MTETEVLKSQNLSHFEQALFESKDASANDFPFFFKFSAVIFVLLAVIFYSPQRSQSETILSPADVLGVLNADRAELGLPELHLNTKLTKAAYEKAHDIFQKNYFSHVSPEGVQPWDFINQTNQPYKTAGENLALNYTNPYELEADFLKSPGHRENLLSQNFSDVGIAVVEGIFKGQTAVVTVQMFSGQ